VLFEKSKRKFDLINFVSLSLYQLKAIQDVHDDFRFPFFFRRFKNIFLQLICRILERKYFYLCRIELTLMNQTLRLKSEKCRQEKF
jgi:hypothetical protein